MTEKRKKLERITTPEGTAVWPNLTKPDTKFNAAGEYRIRIAITAEEAEPIMAKLNELADEAYAEAKVTLEEAVAAATGEKKVKAKKALEKLERADIPCKPCYDEEGSETGNFELSFKMNAERKDKKTGKVIKQSPLLFAANAKPFPASKTIWGGSRVKVSGTIIPYYIPGTGQAGVSLRLAAVQVIKLVSSGSGTASSFGFGATEGDTFEEGMDAGFEDEGGTGEPGDEDGGEQEF